MTRIKYFIQGSNYYSPPIQALNKNVVINLLPILNSYVIVDIERGSVIHLEICYGGLKEMKRRAKMVLTSMGAKIYDEVRRSRPRDNLRTSKRKRAAFSSSGESA